MRHQWPRADVVETGLVTDPDCRGHHYVKWRNPFTGRFIEMWGPPRRGPSAAQFMRGA